MYKKLLIFMTLYCASTAAIGAMYKWTDSSGNTRYDQHPPGGVDAEYIKPPAAVQPAPGQGNSLDAQLEQIEQRRDQEKQQKAASERVQQVASARRQTCERARQDLATLQRGGHRRVRLPDGTVTYLDADQKQQYIDVNQQRIKDNCD